MSGGDGTLKLQSNQFLIGALPRMLTSRSHRAQNLPKFGSSIYYGLDRSRPIVAPALSRAKTKLIVAIIVSGANERPSKDNASAYAM